MNAAISRDELAVWSRYVHEICGIFLDETKAYLLETRLGTLVRETGAGSFSELHYKAKSDRTQTLRRKVVDAITTNETSFFRDAAPFDLLRFKLIPELVDRRRKAGLRPVPIRVWSAACSTGQEAYSTGILLKETLGDLSAYDIRILGTDISDQAVAAASRGVYNKVEMGRGLPPGTERHFQAEPDGAWRIRDEIRALASFRNLNLLEPFAGLGRFDLILCRNVAIYFSEQDRKALFDRMGAALEPEGALVIGATESITGLCPQYVSMRYLRSVYYQLAS
jgi:chemotaxis protein methyltransferase CheR